MIGFGSRKQVKELLKEGLVTVNGEVVNKPIKIEEDDIIEIDGETFSLVENLYFLFNKPIGFTSNKKEPDSLFNLIADKVNTAKLSVAGRLDKDACGLMILSTDGEFIHRISHPKWHVEKEYLVKLSRLPTEKEIKRIEKGVFLGDFRSKPAKIKIIDEKSVTIVVTEGKYHLVKRIFNYFDIEVLFLQRIRIGPITLPNTLKEGELIEIEKSTLKNLKEMLKL